MIRVILVDDHAIVRDGLRGMIGGQRDMVVVGEAADGADAVTVVDATPADVAVLDLSVPHLSGLDLVKVLLERRPSLRIVAFTMQPEDVMAAHLVRAGVAGYVTKERAVTELLDAIRAVARGGRHLSARLTAMLSGRGDGALDALTAREAQVFALIVAGRSVNEIADALEIGASTASNHLSRIREKLGVGTNAEILRYAARAGLL